MSNNTNDVSVSEMSLVGCFFSDPRLASGVCQEHGITEADFYNTRLGTLYRYVTKVFAASASVDVGLVTENMRLGGDLEGVGGIDFCGL